MPTGVFDSALEAEEALERTAAVVVTPATAGFQLHADEAELGDGISIVDTRAVPMRVRTRSRVVRSARDLLLFCVHVAGPARVIQHDRAADVTAGAGVLYETRTPFELVYPATMNSIALQIPRELVPLRSAEITGYTARTLSAQAPAMRLLAGYIGQLRELAADFTAEQRRDVADAAINLLGMALRDTDATPPGGDASGDVLLRMMCQHVRDYVGDRHLSVVELARRHHVSERHVHALFSRMGVTPGGFIREQRLLAARVMLANPANDGRPVADIGASAGFTDPRAFERAFRRQYGMTPGRWRRAYRAAGHSSGISA